MCLHQKKLYFNKGWHPPPPPLPSPHPSPLLVTLFLRLLMLPPIPRAQTHTLGCKCARFRHHPGPHSPPSHHPVPSTPSHHPVPSTHPTRKHEPAHQKGNESANGVRTRWRIIVAGTLSGRTLSVAIGLDRHAIRRHTGRPRGTPTALGLRLRQAGRTILEE
jgi:hypothetical protein